MQARDAKRKNPLHIALIAGEVSGDRLGAALITALRERAPETRFSGMAGPAMRAVGCHAEARAEELSVMGLSEVVRSYPRLYALRARLARHYLEQPPDLLVGIDVPDFTLALERRLKRAGVRTAHLVCPQAWAWRPGRARHLRAALDLLLALFPFEVEFFGAHGVPTRYIGHPLADSLPLIPARAQARAALDIVGTEPLVALLPGSRTQEIERLLGPFVAAAALIARQRPTARFVLCVAREDHVERARAVGTGLPLRVVHGCSQQVLSAADVALAASGTVTLEALLCGTPIVVAYRLTPLSYFIIRRMVRIPHIALPNILAGRELVPELLQDAVTPAALATAALAWLDEPARRADYHARSRELHAVLRCDAAARAADALLELVAAEQP